MNRRDRDLIERCQAARRLIEATSDVAQKRVSVEAFMGIFFPNKQADRAYMTRLKQALKD